MASVIAICVASVSIVVPTASGDVLAQPPSFRILVFSKTAGFRHPSIEPGVAAIKQIGSTNGFGVDASEDAAVFTTANLATYAAVVFLSTTGDILADDQQAAFEGYIRNGGGFVGIHSATDTEYDWAWYGGLVGAYFLKHPAPQDATVIVEDHTHESTAHLGDTWKRFDEWYDFRDDPRDRVHVLLSLDQASYSGSEMGGDHPIAWCHNYDGGRAWYTALGHTDESWAEPAFLQHVLGGTAAGVSSADCSTAADVVTSTTAATTTTTTTMVAAVTVAATDTAHQTSPSTVLESTPSTSTSPDASVPGPKSEGDATTILVGAAVVAGAVALGVGAIFLRRRQRANRARESPPLQ